MRPEEVQRLSAIFMLMTDREARSFLWIIRRYRRTLLQEFAEGLGINPVPVSTIQLINTIQKHFSELRNPKPEKEPEFECIGCKENIPQAQGLRWKKLGEGKPVTVSHDRSNLPSSLVSLTDDEIYKKSFKPWETDVVKFKLLKSGKGDCHIQWKHIDGRGRTLEYVLQPAGDAKFMEEAGEQSGDMFMDISEFWTKTSATEVIKHGAGHVLGIGHNPSPNDVMYGYAGSGVKSLTKNDKRERDERYPSGKAA